jgi:predicted ATPase/DNA-binding XRE family transcriptional regulator
LASAVLDNPDKMPFASLLKQYRHERGLTQEELAEQAGLSARLISDLERGVIQRPRRDTIRMLADGLALSGSDRDDFVLFARNGQVTQLFEDRAPAAVSLPAQPTPLVGREADIDAALAILRQADARLLTMSGPGGVGKTRLALACAERLARGRGIAAHFVDLATITDAVMIWPAIATRIGIATERDRPLEQSVIVGIGEAARILVLDNLEQISDAGPAIARLHAGCPRLMIIATSRGPLHIRAERVFAVPPLGIPDITRPPIPDALTEQPAVQLLVQRAHAVDPAFALSDTNAAAVAGIVVALDGLPLAIELAAARMRMLSPVDLLDRLDQSLPLLTGGAADLPERLQSIRAAVAWSYDLLGPGEQSLLRALAVFAGGFTLTAVERCAPAGPSRSEPVLDRLETLVDKGLVLVQSRPDVAAGPRIRSGMPS